MIQSVFYKLKVQILVLGFLLLGQSELSAKWFAFGAIGGDYYQGDVSESALPNLRTLRLNYGLGVGYFLNFRWSLRLRYMKGAFHGSDAYFSTPSIQARGITFDNSFWDIGLHAMYHHLFKKSYKLINYGFIGIEYMNQSVTKTITGTAALVPEGSFSNTQFNAPIGIGLGRWVSAHWGVVLELAYHYNFSDYLDGTVKAGNPKANDSFIVSHLLVLYRFRAGGNPGGVFDPSKLNNVDCPKFGY